MKKRYNRYGIAIACLAIVFVFSQGSATIIVTGSVHGQLDPCG